MSKNNPYYGTGSKTNWGMPSDEIKSHSSVLYNERVSAMFSNLELEFADLLIKPDLKRANKVYALMFTLWKMIRPLVSNNPSCRHHLGLDVAPGIYTVDVGFKKYKDCEKYIRSSNELTYEQLDYMVEILNGLDLIIREILQYYKYFIRPEYTQKPDINMASQRYKEMADERTIEELKEVIGEKNIQKLGLVSPDKVIDEFNEFEKQIDLDEVDPNELE